MITILGSVAGSVVALAAAWTLLDVSVMSESEHEQAPHNGLIELIQIGDLKSFCYYLDDRINRKRDRIYDLEQRAADPEYIRDEKAELKKLETQFDKNDCSMVVSVI